MCSAWTSPRRVTSIYIYTHLLVRVGAARARISGFGPSSFALPGPQKHRVFVRGSHFGLKPPFQLRSPRASKTQCFRARHPPGLKNTVFSCAAAASASKHHACLKNTPLGLKNIVFSCVAATFKETLQGRHLCYASLCAATLCSPLLCMDMRRFTLVNIYDPGTRPQTAK
jgi:hypothetical protein